MSNTLKYNKTELLEQIKIEASKGSTLAEMSKVLNIPTGSLGPYISEFRKKGLLPSKNQPPVSGPDATSLVANTNPQGNLDKPTPRGPAGDPLRRMIPAALRNYKKALNGEKIDTNTRDVATKILKQFGYLEPDNESKSDTEAYYSKLTLHELRNKIKTIQASLTDELGPDDVVS